MTTEERNELVYQIAARAKELANRSMNDLRISYPAVTETKNQLVKLCRDMGWSRGDMIEAILNEEFTEETI